MRFILTENYEQLSRQAALQLAAHISLKPDGVLGLATGSTPLGTYRELIRLHREAGLSFSRIRTCNLDEYKGLPGADSQSYACFMRKNLFDHIDIRLSNTHIPNGENPDAGDECSRFERTIRSLGGIDLQLLGLGHNGHIGFNEPAEAFPMATHCVTLSQSTIEANTRFFENSAQVPTMAYTMGIGTIFSARSILLLVSGQGKASILRNVLTGPVTPHVPASVLQLHPDCTVIADRDAASLLSEELTHVN